MACVMSGYGPNVPIQYTEILYQGAAARHDPPHLDRRVDRPSPPQEHWDTDEHGRIRWPRSRPRVLIGVYAIAMNAVQVGASIEDSALVEIEVTAVVPQG